MEYHIVYVTDMDETFYTVRPKIEGLTDLEWELGCRIYQIKEVKAHKLFDYLYHLHLYPNVLDKDDWSRHLENLVDPIIVPSNKFVGTHRPYDKWEQRFPIWGVTD